MMLTIWQKTCPLTIRRSCHPCRVHQGSSTIYSGREAHVARGLSNRGMSEEKGLTSKDKSLLDLFLHICNHKWERLTELGNACYANNASLEEVIGCVRHIVVVSGYPASLAAAKKLHAAGLITETVPGKCGGEIGNAFDLVYADKAERVWQNLYKVEPVLTEWIRVHCYGDVYSTPGLTLKQKQLMISSFLAEANMPDEFFGHVLAGARFGCSQAEFLEGVDMAFEIAQSEKEKEALRTHMRRLISKAVLKVNSKFPDGLPPLPTVENPTETVRLPSEPSRK